MIKVLVAGPQRAFAEALAMRIGAEPGVDVVGAVASADEALRGSGARPDLATVDLAVLDMDADETFLALADHLRGLRPGIGLVGLAGGEDETAALTSAVHRGVRGWVRKSADIGELLDVLHGVHRGETRIPALLLTGLLDRLLSELAEERAADRLLASLTPRERQVLEAMSRGASRLEIADELAISVDTVRTHTQNVLTKLNVHSSLAAVRVARRAGLG